MKPTRDLNVHPPSSWLSSPVVRGLDALFGYTLDLARVTSYVRLQTQTLPFSAKKLSTAPVRSGGTAVLPAAVLDETIALVHMLSQPAPSSERTGHVQ